MKMDPRGVSNAISSYNGMVLDVLAAIISFAPNHIITNRREKCLKQYSGFDLSPHFMSLLLSEQVRFFEMGLLHRKSVLFEVSLNTKLW